MGKQKRKQNILYKRLDEALQQGIEVWVKVSSTAFFGIPVHLDGEFVELLSLYLPEDTDDPEDDNYYRKVFLIKLSEIVALSYPSDLWSKERLEELLKQSEIASETET